MALTSQNYKCSISSHACESVHNFHSLSIYLITQCCWSSAVVHYSSETCCCDFFTQLRFNVEIGFSEEQVKVPNKSSHLVITIILNNENRGNCDVDNASLCACSQQRCNWPIYNTSRARWKSLLIGRIILFSSGGGLERTNVGCVEIYAFCFRGCCYCPSSSRAIHPAIDIPLIASR